VSITSRFIRRLRSHDRIGLNNVVGLAKAAKVFKVPTCSRR